jgi:hypothetical protein
MRNGFDTKANLFPSKIPIWFTYIEDKQLTTIVVNKMVFFILVFTCTLAETNQYDSYIFKLEYESNNSYSKENRTSFVFLTTKRNEE